MPGPQGLGRVVAPSPPTSAPAKSSGSRARAGRRTPQPTANLALRRRSDRLLAVVDAAAAVGAAWAAGALLHRTITVAWSGYALIALTTVLAGRWLGLYRRAALRPGSNLVEPAVGTAGVAGAAATLVVLLSPPGPGFAWAALIACFLLVALLVVRRVLAHARRALVPLGVGLERYAVLGESPAMRRLVADLTRASGAPFRVVGTVPEGLPAQQTAAEVGALSVDGLLVPPDLDPAQVGALSRALAGHDVEVLVAPRAHDLDAQVTSVTHLQGIPLLRLGGAAPRRRAVRTPVRDRRTRGVAILGTRGIPAAYGGFETFAEQLAVRLVADGTPVTVYCRSHFATGQTTHRGARLVTLPTIRSKYLDTVVHTALSAVHVVLTGGPRDVLVCNAANAPVVPFLRLFGRRVVLNVDGLEWRRGKWGVLGRSWYRMGEWLSVRTASVLVTDAEEVRTYYRVRHETDSVMVPYGAEQLARGSLPLDPRTPVEPDSYALYVSRWERENNPLLVARAHAAAGTALGLVLLGKAAYDDELEAQVHAAARLDACLPGPVYGDGYRALIASARCYVHATEVGGTHPALVEAMGAGNLCLVLDTPENREVAGSVAWYFADEAELTHLLERADRLPSAELEELRARTRAWAARRYSWDTVAQAYDRLLFG
jgi:glycosyltransferase involved in cell wall biosynthesis